MESKKFLENPDTLVISGGGVKGFILLGAIQAAMDNNLLSDIKIYAGTSIGAILAYLFAIGYTPMELMVELHMNNWLEKTQFFNVVAMTNGNGATSFTPIQEGLEKLTLKKIGRFITMKMLKELYGKTLIACSYNMTTCRAEYLHYESHPDLPCLTALRLSANIPLIFDRFQYMDCYYIDGGICDNFPVIEAEKYGEKILGINLVVSERNMKDNPEEGIVAYLTKIMAIPVAQMTKYRVQDLKKSHTIINIHSGDMMSAISLNAKTTQRLEMFSTGYTGFKEEFEKIVQKLN